MPVRQSCVYPLIALHRTPYLRNAGLGYAFEKERIDATKNFNHGTEMNETGDKMIFDTTHHHRNSVKSRKCTISHSISNITASKDFTRNP